jgi:NADPH:quinone reductase-like Zn-dependent oxidoreductase
MTERYPSSALRTGDPINRLMNATWCHIFMSSAAGGGRDLRPVVHGEFAREDAAVAHEVIEARRNLGKVVLHP